MYVASFADGENERLFTVVMKHSATPNNTATTFLTAAELAARWKLTPMTLRRWRHAKKLKAHHLGRGIRFAMAEIERVEQEATA